MRLLDSDPVTGLKTYVKHEDGKSHIFYVEDVEPQLEAAQWLRNTDDHFKAGVKNSWLHYAHIPDTEIIKLIKHGINPYAHDVNMRDLFKYVNTNLKQYKLTTKTHDKNSIWE